MFRKIRSAPFAVVFALGVLWGMTLPVRAEEKPANAPVPAAPAQLACEAAPCDLLPAPAGDVPFGGPLGERAKLTGDWGGFRDSLAEHGVTLDVSNANYYQGITSGGREQTFKFGGRLDYFLDIDGQKAGLWQGLLINLHGETVYADSVNALTGALLPVNMGRLFPEPFGTVTALTGVKLTQALSEHFAVFGGKINTLDLLPQPFLPGRGPDVGFMNLGMVFNPVLARTVPYSTLGGGASVLVDGKPAATILVLDTNNTPTTSGFETFFDNGATILAMSGLPSKFFGMPGVHILTGTYSSGRYTNTDTTAFTILGRILAGLPPTETTSGSWSLVYQFQQTLWIDGCNPARTWGLFGNAGIADTNPNQFPWSVCVGVAGSSPLACRKFDTFGLAYYYMGLSDHVKNFAPRLIPLSDEHAVELFYDIGVTPWCHFTPDLQVTHGALERNDTAVVLGLRVKIDF